MTHIKQYVVIGRRNSAMLMQYGTLESFLHPVRGCHWSVPYTFIYAKNMYGAHCYHIPTRKRIRRILEQELRNGQYTKQFFRSVHQRWERVIRNIAQFSRKDFRKEPLINFHRYYDAFYEIYIATLFPMMIAIYSSDLQDLLESALCRVLPKDQQSTQNIIAHMAFLLTPPRLTFVQQEEQLLFTILQRFEFQYHGTHTSKRQFVAFCRQLSIDRILTQLEQNYGWFHMEYVGEPKTKREYIDLLWNRFQAEKDITKNQISPHTRMRIALRQQKLFYNEHKNTKFLRELVRVLQEFALVLDYSKVELIHGIYLARPMLEELSRQLKIHSWILVRNLTPSEMHAALNRGYLTSMDRKNIHARASEYALWLKDGEILLYHGKDARQIKNKLLREPRTTGVREFSGLIAMTGKVRGVAKIVTNAQALKKFKNGEILVVDEITTELTSALKPAVAIIANGGGIMSHTAIVAREFQTPCIVGTKIATRVLKDGDTIEVDANRGIVKKLN